ncbi:pyridoxamine 5'-phosphate oxidase family protein [Adhaeribacter swui]|uniref:Pyridoxamine 5'-phosphate oxidase family protein n=2 Tax=Adhaeribacter swui TaxID=2086471 RepID=A0A7G7GFB8_9BACT|nr:pyridoxamine 5'-phosphate oxidase family protein [Adhaeribacter swui]
MDSINQQQPEKNHQNLHGSQAGLKIKELAEKADTCFFCTKITTDQPLKVRPMSVRKVDEDGTLYFLSASDSHKNADIQADPNVHLLFQGSEHSDFLSVFGTATIGRDPEQIKELWNPIAKTWFTEGVDDPRITVLRITPTEGYYWDNKHGNTVAFAKILVGSIIGQTLDDSIEGKLSV